MRDRFVKFVTILPAIVCSFAVFAQEGPKNIGNVQLDSCQDIFFDQFAPNTFSLNVLQNKDKFALQNLIIGGSAEADLQHWQGDKIVTVTHQRYQAGNGLYLTQAQIDAMTQVNPWSTVFLSLTDSHIENQSNLIYSQHAFLLLGDLTKLPAYLTLGINTLPFGVFTGSGPWNNPLTADYFNPVQAPQVNLGVYKNGINANATAYKDGVNHDKNYAYSLSFAKDKENLSGNFGIGYLTDLKTNAAGNYSATHVSRHLSDESNMGGIWDMNASISYGSISLSGEVVHGTKKVGGNDGKPEALSGVLTYTHSIFGTDTTFGVGHSVTLYLKNIPTSLTGNDAILSASSGIKNDSSASVSRSIFVKNFVLGFDVERETTYAKDSTYSFTLDLMGYL
jgi:hypothetical protein